MSEADTIYCTQCASPGPRGSAYCGTCGMPRELTPKRRAAHVAFLLNEMQAPPMTDIVTAEQCARLEAHYEGELGTYLAPQRTPEQAPTPRPATISTPGAGATAAIERVAPPLRVAPPPMPPREPYDWSWLAEQQASLFLFAGAFLTVVAALIYVGYSGQAVSGTVKIAILIVYTLAFLGAGWLCLRIPKVETAGRVFFGVGALLVPMNFAAARGIFGTEEDLSAETMWLAGSVTTAAFYAAVAWIGLGRMYAFGAGVSIISSAIAAAVVTDMPVEWTPLLFIAVALGMVLTDAAGIEKLRERVGAIWGLQGQALGALALGWLLIIATYEVADSGVVTDPASYGAGTLWFLPVTLAAFAAASAAPMLLTKRDYYAIAALGALAAAGVTVAYAFELPAEGWAVAFAAAGACFGLMLIMADDTSIAKGLPARFGEYVFGYGVALTAIAGLIALFALRATYGDTASYEIRTRWFLAPSFGLALAFYALSAASKRGRAGTGAIAVAVGGMASLAGAWIATIYGLDWPAEAYAIGVAALAPALALALIAAQDRRIARFLPEHLLDAAYGTAILGTIVSAIIAGGTIAVAEQDIDPYELRTRWFLLPALALSAAFYVYDAVAQRRGFGVPGFVIAITGVAASVVYGLNVSAEYYAFALITPAITLIAAARWAPRADELLGAAWRDDVALLGRIATGAGMFTASIAALAGADAANDWTPQSHVFLPIAFLAGTVFLGIDASRGRRIETSLAFVAALGASAVAVPYAFEAHAAYYGVALIGTGFILAASGRIWTPSWLDGRARDGLAVAGVAAATLPFEIPYADLPGIGAGVHFGAALFFALIAVSDRSARTFEYLINAKAASKVRLAMGWLYAAALCAAIGYIFVLRNIASDEQVEGGSLAVPMLTVTIALLLVGVATKFWRPEFRLHFYAMSLVAALISIATAQDTGTHALVLTVFVAAYIAIAAIENAPVIATPSVLFGFIAVAVWRAHLDASFAVLPIAYSLVAFATYCAALAVKDRLPQWSMALRATGAAYALVAPVAGFGVLSVQSEGGLFNGEPFEQSVLYQFSTLAVAGVGALALVESMLARRTWIIVPASAVLLVALLLQIGSLRPENAQAYTAVIGAYLVLLAVVGISRLRLIPALGEYTVYIEALGAATIMLPSFAQSIDAGWRYQWILLIEAVVFLAAGIVMRRRGILSAGALFLVLAAGRLLFDAINAMPNWIVVALSGIALLGVGMGILLGRDQWDRWQRTVLSWWNGEDDGALVH